MTKTNQTSWRGDETLWTNKTRHQTNNKKNTKQKYNEANEGWLEKRCIEIDQLKNKINRKKENLLEKKIQRQVTDDQPEEICKKVKNTIYLFIYLFLKRIHGYIYVEWNYLVLCQWSKIRTTLVHKVMSIFNWQRKSRPTYRI